MKRVGQPEDVADAATSSLQVTSLHITGAVLPVDGGMTVWGNRFSHWWCEAQRRLHRPQRIFKPPNSLKGHVGCSYVSHVLYKRIDENNDYDRQREQHAKYKPTPKNNIAASTVLKHLNCEPRPRDWREVPHSRLRGQSARWTYRPATVLRMLFAMHRPAQPTPIARLCRYYRSPESFPTLPARTVIQLTHPPSVSTCTELEEGC